MEFAPVLVTTKLILTELKEAVAVVAAKRALADVQQDLNYDADARKVDQLRRYMKDRSSVERPREVWVHGEHIRAVQPRRNGQMRSAGWFQQFKRESGLADCPSRAFAQHGRMREWCFADIATTWDRYYVLR